MKIFARNASDSIRTHVGRARWVWLTSLVFAMALASCGDGTSEDPADGGDGADAGMETVETPTFSVAAGTYDADQAVELSTTTPAATIYFTTDGSAPSATSTEYTGPIAVTGHGTTTTIRAIATHTDMNDSAVAEATYTIEYGVVAVPTFSVAAGTYDADQSVELSTTTTAATIHFTIDGSSPTTTSPMYGSAIAVAGNGTTMTIRAIAVKPGMTDSSIAESAYTITYQMVVAPTFTPDGGFVDPDTDVTITTTTTTATIWYTTGDGTQADPTCGTGTSGTADASTTMFTIGSSVTIKAIGCRAGWAGSTVAEAAFSLIQIYVADMNNDRIVRMDDPSGSNWTTLGTSGTGANQFGGPYGLTFDASGRIYVLDRTNNRIVRMDDFSGAGWVVLCDNPPSSCSAGSGNYQFAWPEGIAIDASGRIYVADSGNNRIVRFDDMTGANWTVLCDNPPSSCTAGTGTNQFDFPSGIHVAPGGQILVADTYNHRIVGMDDMSGTNWTALGAWGSGANEFMYPTGIAADASDNIYVADKDGGRVVSMENMSGTNWRAYTGTTPYTSPVDVHIDSQGRIYVVDITDHFISRMDDMFGTNWTTLGTNGSGTNQFINPRGIFGR